MTTSATPSQSLDGVPVSDLANRLGVPRVVALDVVSSTLDVAHALGADGAPAGTLVVADAQRAGRGRHGRTWQSAPGAGVWLTLLERSGDPAALEVLSLRVGLQIAPALDVFAADRVRLKWPNDLYVQTRKLAGVLVEARWRDGAPEWIAIGVGINLRAPAAEPNAVGLGEGVSRVAVLEAVVPAIRRAARASGRLSADEVERFAERDLALGRRCSAPVAGRVSGVDGSGALLVRVGSSTRAVRSGSLILEEEP